MGPRHLLAMCATTLRCFSARYLAVACSCQGALRDPDSLLKISRVKSPTIESSETIKHVTDSSVSPGLLVTEDDDPRSFPVHSSFRCEPILSEVELERREAFRVAMSRVPSPVSVVTSLLRLSPQVKAPEGLSGIEGVIKRGVTCSSLTSVSLNPPIISFCIQRPSRMTNLLLASKSFAVHVLSEDQVDLSIRFSMPLSDQTDQFCTIPHTVDENDLPILSHTLAVLKCTALDVHEIGDHNVWYGEVSSAVSCNMSEKPLLYFSRSYRSIGEEAFMAAFQNTTLPFEYWTHQGHLRMAWNRLTTHPLPQATTEIKSGIKAYNEKHLDQLKTGYSETITMFYIHMVHHAIQRPGSKGPPTYESFIERNQHLLDRSLAFKFYSRERFLSQEAKDSFLTPDLLPLP